MNKVIVNNLEKIFVTSDASTIIEQLEVQHPAANLLALASKMQVMLYALHACFSQSFTVN